MTAGKVAAVVVTHDRPDKLRACVASVLASERPVQELIVVDNASGPETAEVLASFGDRIRVIRLDENRGGAGGFNEGVRRAHLAGADHVWLMDDDARVTATALGALLDGVEQFETATGGPPGFACSVVEWSDGSLCLQNAPVLTRDAPRLATPECPLLLARSCSFVSVLVPRWGITEVGLPIADFFLWYDDTEYTQRLSEQAPGIYCLHSRVVHDTGTNEDIDFGHATGGARWKYELGIRNQAAWTRRNRGPLQVIELVLRRRLEMRAAGLGLSDRLAVYRAWVRGLTFGYEIEPAPTGR